MDKITHEVRQAQWEAIILKCNNSGMSKKAWLEKNNVNEKQFYYWQRRIRTANAQANMVSTGEPVSPCRVPAVDFAEVVLPPAMQQAAVTKPDAVLRMGNMTLEISNTLSPALLAALWQVMAHAQ